jgi:autotransporter translocation and assembly factor TamB
VAPATRPVTIPYLDTVDLNIVIGHRQPFAVENNVAQLNISPDIKIGGTLANPIVSGRAQVRDGTVTFQRRNFEVKRGIIDFVNPYRTEAEIDIESEAEIRTWKVNLAIKGTLDNLDITLTSIPTETDADILSLILFGRTARELTAGEGGSQRTTGQIMAEMLSDTLGDDLRKRTGVDILQLETTDGTDDRDPGGIKVTVGKHLSDRMTVKYAIETNQGETQQWAIMEYKLLERILVNGSQSNAGLFGAELVYRIEFR